MIAKTEPKQHADRTGIKLPFDRKLIGFGLFETLRHRPPSPPANRAMNRLNETGRPENSAISRDDSKFVHG